MTPAELLSRTPESIEHDFSCLVGCSFNFIPEVDCKIYTRDTFVSTETDRVEIRVYKHFDFDYRRFWRLASVHFDGRPVMITRNAGREGDDHRSRVMLDLAAYDDMIAFMLTLPRKPCHVPDHDQPTTHHVGMDEDFPALGDFYGNSLDGYFESY